MVKHGYWEDQVDEHSELSRVQGGHPPSVGVRVGTPRVLVGGCEQCIVIWVREVLFWNAGTRSLSALYP